MEKHGRGFLAQMLDHSRQDRLFYSKNQAKKVEYLMSGTYGDIHRITNADGTSHILKSVELFRPDDHPDTWRDMDEMYDFIEAFLGTYYTKEYWPESGYDGPSIPLMADREGMQFKIKEKDPLLHLLDYYGVVMLSDSAEEEFFRHLAAAGHRTKGMSPIDIDRIEKTAREVHELVVASLDQILLVMLTEPGDSKSSLSYLVRYDMNLSKYGTNAIAQLLCSLYLLNKEDGFVHGDASGTN